MKKEKQIKTMVEIMWTVCCDECENCKYHKYGEFCVAAQQAEKLIDAGYGKVSDAVKSIYDMLTEGTVCETDTVLMTVAWLKTKMKDFGLDYDSKD